MQVFAIDNGFAGTVSANCLYVLPEELLQIPPQVLTQLKKEPQEKEPQEALDC